MPYTPQTWADGPGGGTPITASRLTNVENGIQAASDTADAALPKSGGIVSGLVEFISTLAGTLLIGTKTAEPAAGVTNLVDVRSNKAAVGGMYIKHVPDGPTTNHALTVNQTGTTGTGSALNVASSGRDISAVQIRGSETDTGTVKITHVNASGTATGDAGSAALSLDVQPGTSGGTASHGIFVTSTGGTGTAGYLMLLRNGGADTCTVNSNGDFYTVGRALGQAQPADHGLAAWSYDPIAAVNTSVVTGGVVNLIRVAVPHPVTISKIYWHVGVVAAGVTAGQNHVGLYSSAGVRMATANVDAVVTSTGVKTTAVTPVELQPGYYWIAILCNGTTPPGLARTTGLAGGGGLINVGLGASASRFALSGAGQGALPLNITTGALTQGLSLWGAIGT